MINIRNELMLLKDEKYKKFQEKIIPNINNIIGVRMPLIRKLTKKVSEKDQINYIENYNCEYLEEYLIKGIFISNINDINLVISYLEIFIKEIDNWAVCDLTVSSLKIISYNKVEIFKFINKYVDSKKEFELRFIIVILLNYYIYDEYIDEIFSILEKIKTDYYYVKMAKAWLISMMYISNRKKTDYFIKNKIDDKEVKRMTIRKIIESNQISTKEKNTIRKKYL